MSMILLSIDVTQLDKRRFKSITRKNGKPAVFCNLVLIPTPESKYGDYIVKQGVTKEEVKARIEMPILGNATKLENSRAHPAKPAPSDPPEDSDGDDVPF